MKMLLTHKDMTDWAHGVAEKLMRGDLEDQVYPTGVEHVTATVEEMASIPPNSNPFLHDSFSMGTDLVRGWMVMHPGFDNAKEPRALEWLYLVNTRTGQRIKVNLEHEQPPVCTLIQPEERK